MSEAGNGMGSTQKEYTQLGYNNAHTTDSVTYQDYLRCCITDST